jgi:ComF family protein
MINASKKRSTSSIVNLWNDLLSLWYPNVCVGCSRNLLGSEQILCTYCKKALPYTGFCMLPGNLMEKQFWGKINFERATAFLFFHKQGVTQQLIHKLKYKGRTDVGEWLGRQMGLELLNIYPFNKANYIIPVPLHHSKERLRGYNQSDYIASGMSQTMNVPVEKKLLFRLRMNETQTRKSRLERWKNVDELFECMQPEKLNGKRILLVDDVITTGSTMEACAQALYDSCSDIKISFVSAAIAHH